MARYQVQGPDGAMHIIEGPDNAKPEDIEAFAAQSIPKAAPAPAPPKMADAPIMDMPLAMGITPRRALGLVRGAKDIVDTGASYAARGFDKLAGTNEAPRVDAMNKAGEADYQGLVGDNSDAKISRVAGQGLVTAPIGGIMAQGARLAGAGSRVVNALASNGFTTGAPAAASLAGRAGDLAIRSGAGAATAGAAGSLIDPEHAGTIAAIGGVLPGFMKAAGVVGNALGENAQSGARWLMNSALKPTAEQLKNGEAATAVETLLKYGINPNMKGVEKLRGLISGLNDQVSNKIASSTATIDKSKVVNALSSTRERFGNQVAPTADLGAINNIEADFLNHPNYPGQELPIQAAQKLKQGTYNTLAGKYGEMGSAGTEAQKGLARGLKEQIVAAEPAVGQWNAEESKLISTLDVSERAALNDLKKNPIGITALAHSPRAWALAMADRSPTFKALAARMLNAVSESAPSVNALAGPAVYRSLPRAGQRN